MNSFHLSRPYLHFARAAINRSSLCACIPNMQRVIEYPNVYSEPSRERRDGDRELDRRSLFCSTGVETS